MDAHQHEGAAMSTTTTHPAATIQLRGMPSARTRRVTSVAAAGIVALVTWLNVHVFGDVELVVGSGPDAVNLGGVRIVASAMAAALAGWAVLAVIERRVGRGAHALRLWRRIAIGVAIVSLIGPRSEERCVGKGGVGKCRYRWAADHTKK